MPFIEWKFFNAQYKSNGFLFARNIFCAKILIAGFVLSHHKKIFIRSIEFVLWQLKKCSCRKSPSTFEGVGNLPGDVTWNIRDRKGRKDK